MFFDDYVNFCKGQTENTPNFEIVLFPSWNRTDSLHARACDVDFARAGRAKRSPPEKCLGSIESSWRMCRNQIFIGCNLDGIQYF